jgi:cytidylate kinase
MPVITISRQFGSAGVPIGRALADRFDAEFLDRKIVALVAARAGIPENEAEGYDERLPSLWQRIASALAASSPEVAVPPMPYEHMPSAATHERLVAITRTVIEEAAARGNVVIVGRGAAFVLGRGRHDVVHVQLHASMEARIRYLLTRVEEIPLETRPDEHSLEELCRSVDRARSEYIRRLFRVNWTDATNYDLALDSGRLGVARSVALIEMVAREGVAEVSTPTEPQAARDAPESER